jgi:hypothetical protein
MTADGVHGFFGWCGFFGMHNWDGLHRDGNPPATAHQVSRVHHADPTMARTVTLQMASHAPSLQPERTAGRHRADAQPRWSYQQTRADYFYGEYRARHQAGFGQYDGFHR